MPGVKEAVKLTNLGLENYVKESRERLLTATRSVDVGLIEPIRETTLFFGGKIVIWPVCEINQEIATYSVKQIA